MVRGRQHDWGREAPAALVLPARSAPPREKDELEFYQTFFFFFGPFLRKNPYPTLTYSLKKKKKEEGDSSQIIL